MHIISAFHLAERQTYFGEINQRVLRASASRDIRAEAKRALDAWRSERMFAAECEMFVVEP